MLEPLGKGERARAVLFICDFNAHGGTQTHLLHLFEMLDRRRFRPALATLNLHPVLARRLSELDVEVTNLELDGAFRLATFRKTASLATLARQGGFGLLHGSLFQGNILTAAVSTLSGVPCITSVRNVDLWKRRRHHLASAAAHRRARRVVFNSAVVRDRTAELERIPLEKTVLIPNAVPDVAATPVPASDDASGNVRRPTAICVASLRPKKGHVHLIESFGLVHSRLPEARLVLVGEGPLRDDLRRLVTALGLDAAVTFAGYRADVADLLRDADVFVLSSLEEGMPNALLEAMAAGLPSVVTDVGGMPEVLEEGFGGYLVPPARPESMADRLHALLSDTALRRRQGALARRRYESSFTIERMTTAYEALYEEVLAG